MKFDDDGPWDLEVEGFEVLGMTFGPFSAEIIAYGPEGATSKIRLNGPFELRDPRDDTKVVDTDSWERLAALCVLRNDKIRLARISNANDLRVEFESGFTITSTSASDYESWEIHGPGKVIAISTMGDGPPAIWGGDPKRTVTYSRGRYFDSDGNEIPEPQFLKDWGNPTERT
jgi:hypothetical protein